MHETKDGFPRPVQVISVDSESASSANIMTSNGTKNIECMHHKVLHDNNNWKNNSLHKF